MASQSTFNPPESVFCDPEQRKEQKTCVAEYLAGNLTFQQGNTSCPAIEFFFRQYATPLSTWIPTTCTGCDWEEIVRKCISKNNPHRLSLSQICKSGLRNHNTTRCVR